MFLITAGLNTEVVLGSYKYPWWAHLIGRFIVAIITTPLIEFSLRSMVKGGIFRVN